MRIGVDAHILSGKFQGSRTYLLNLYKEVLKQNDKNEYIFFGYWDNQQPYGKHVKYVNFKSMSKWKRLTYQTNPLMKQNKIQLFHSNYISPIINSCDSLLTIHDILFETHPQFFSNGEVLRNKLLIRQSAHRARQIHTVSEYSKRSLINIYGIPEKKIKVVPNGVDLEKFNPDAREVSLQIIKEKFNVSDYILTVGRIEPRKNHASLIRAYQMLKSQLPKLGPLVIVGNPDFGYDEFFKLIEESDIRDSVKVIKSLDDNLLPYIYKAARLFVYPSFAEGFGIPPIEAMASGVPIVSSNVTAISEVVGEAGLLADPRFPEEISSQMKKVLENSDLHLKLSELGLQHSRKWTWKRAAEAYIEALQTM